MSQYFIDNATKGILTKDTQSSASPVFTRLIGFTASSDNAIVTRPVGYDNVGNVQAKIGYEHHQVHAGRHFYVAGFAVKGDGEEILFTFQTPPTGRKAHMTFQIEGQTQTEMYIYEGSSYDVDSAGAQVTPINNDRNSIYTSVNCLRNAPVLVNTGSLIFSQSKGVAGATPSKAASEGIVDREKELILAAGKQYAFLIVSKAASNTISYNGEWYEHADVY